MTNRTAIKTTHFKLISILLFSLFIVIGLIFFNSPAKAVTTITVNDSWTWQDLKTAIETTYEGTDVVFSINRSSALSATSQITIPDGTTVTLQCANESHNYSATDIVRNKDFHGSLFRVNSGATFNVQCCISGGSNSSTGLLLYDADNVRITDADTLSSLWNKLINTHYFAPSNYIYYGKALVWVDGGTVNVNNEKGVLKYNYNPYSSKNSKKYTDGIYRFSDREVPATYSETVDGTSVKLLYYNLPAQKFEDELAGGHKGSAIYNKKGKVVFSAGKIYGCVSSAGPAIEAAMTDIKSTEISGGQLYINLAREEGGGAVSAFSVVENPSTLNQLSIKGGTINKNRATLKGGGFCTNYSANITMTGGTISDNTALGGGGIYVNGGDEDLDIPHGGKAYIHGGTIKNNNITGGNGGGVLVGTTNTENNVLSVKNTVISGNTAYGGNPNEETLGETSNLGSGGGIYVAGGCAFTMENVDVTKNRALGGTHPTDGAVTGKGGGIYIVSKGPVCTIIGGSVTSNSATDYGGGIVTGRTNGLTITNGLVVSLNTADFGAGIYNGSTGATTLSGGKIYNNTATTSGGGISNNGTLNVLNGEISSNQANLYGGGVYNVGVLSLSDGEIKTNSSGYGAGVYNGSAGTITLTNGKIYNNSATNAGGGISTAGKVTIKGGEIYSNTALNGGGVLVAGDSSSLTMTAGKIHANTAQNGGGIFLKLDGSACTISNAEIYNNTCQLYGAGIYSERTTGLTIKNSKIHGNIGHLTDEDLISTYTATTLKSPSGGGVFLGKNTVTEIIDSEIYENIVKNTETAVGNTGAGGGGVYSKDKLTVTNSSIYNNSSDSLGGGVQVYGGTTTILNSTIKSNTANVSGGGIYSAMGTVVKISKSSVNTNIAKSYGGGVWIGYATCSLTDGSTVHNNTAGKSGGGIYTFGDIIIDGEETSVYKNTAPQGAGLLGNINGGSIDMTGGSIHSNKADNGYGGGVYMVRGTFNFIDGKIYSNEATNGTGGGVFLTLEGILNMPGGEIYENTASMGAGVYVSKNCLFNMTDGIIYSNTGKSGNGVYLANNGSFKMSEKALIEKDNVVYLQNKAFITVPATFTGNKNIRAIITGADMIPGRVIAKYGDTADDTGSSALYWNANTPKMSEQYFNVKDKELRSGDQGAADNYDSLNNQDVFITEKYNISFDMNPPALNTKSVTHIIGEKEYIFNDLSNTKSHTPFYKYWYEEASFNVGNAIADDHEILEEWNTDINGVGESFSKNETVSLSAEKNEDYILYAQWQIKIEIDYNGNGATKGENFTDTDFSITDATYTLNSGEKADGAPVFERTETDEETGETKLFSFTGWSFNKNDKAYRFKKGEKITTDALRTNAMIVDGRLSYVTTMYAIWDQYPTIRAVDRWFTLGEAQNGKITLTELLSSAKATDGEVGKKTDFYDKDDETNELIITDKEEFTIIDFNESDFKSFTTSGNATVTYKAVDAYGNEAYKTVVVHIVDNEAQKQDETTRFTRFISSNYFKDTNGDFVEPQYGGLKENSKWRTDSEYSSLLGSTLSNKKDVLTKKWDTVRETWNWTIDEIELCKSFVATHGVGNAENPNALKDFYNQFGPDN